MKIFTKLAISLLVLMPLTACNRSDEKAAKAASDEILKTLNDAKKRMEAVAPQLSSIPTDELQKLNSFEYKVVEIPAYYEGARMEAKLNELGQDRWECIGITLRGETTQLIMKRRPASYLRYIPRLFP